MQLHPFCSFEYFSSLSLLSYFLSHLFWLPFLISHFLFLFFFLFYYSKSSFFSFLVYLSLCQPIMRDPLKVQKIDWKFLLDPPSPSSAYTNNCRDSEIFPADLTRLTPPTAFSQLNNLVEDSTDHSIDTIQSPSEFNFITTVTIFFPFPILFLMSFLVKD